MAKREITGWVGGERVTRTIDDVAPKGMRSYKVMGVDTIAHPGCIDGFRTDRRMGMIYPACRIQDIPGVWAHESAAILSGTCAYCGER